MCVLYRVLYKNHYINKMTRLTTPTDDATEFPGVDRHTQNVRESVLTGGDTPHRPSPLTRSDGHDVTHAWRNFSFIEQGREGASGR